MQCDCVVLIFLNKTGLCFVRQRISWQQCRTVHWTAIVRNYFAWPTQSTTPDMQLPISTLRTWPTWKLERGSVHVSQRALQDHSHFLWICSGLHGLLDGLLRTFLMTSKFTYLRETHCFQSCLGTLSTLATHFCTS